MARRVAFVVLQGFLCSANGGMVEWWRGVIGAWVPRERFGGAVGWSHARPGSAIAPRLLTHVAPSRPLGESNDDRRPATAARVVGSRGCGWSLAGAVVWLLDCSYPKPRIHHLAPRPNPRSPTSLGLARPNVQEDSMCHSLHPDLASLPSSRFFTHCHLGNLSYCTTHTDLIGRYLAILPPIQHEQLLSRAPAEPSTPPSPIGAVAIFRRQTIILTTSLLSPLVSPVAFRNHLVQTLFAR
jgi:hypothetical protein